MKKQNKYWNSKIKSFFFKNWSLKKCKTVKIKKTADNFPNLFQIRIEAISLFLMVSFNPNSYFNIPLMRSATAFS